MLWLSSPAAAVELREIEVRRGTDGLVEAPLTVSNASPEVLSCTAELAHWYSKDMGTIAPGARSTFALWFDPESGTFSLLNAGEDNMPVEKLWCGFAGRAYETRAAFSLARAAARERSVDCAPSGDHARLECE
ncbi:hypothetical protein [Pseudohoeflea coraliihabitans]|uniref:Uncharacterized protein n=1 Tax=Pseudohoeflea coraliihabitans TaxID=2860393 RepID=A0ABS6WS85_9HYPH|nr:hypothetical protein [Pseudohoeflea sp. DP4N28-3]MBW3098277.1 hypothetical protein [Pseudohoeflea sp. DP4N28-3]